MNAFFVTFVYLYVVIREQTTFQSWFFLFTMWAPRIKLGSDRVAVGPYSASHWADLVNLLRFLSQYLWWFVNAWKPSQYPKHSDHIHVGLPPWDPCRIKSYSLTILMSGCYWLPNICIYWPSWYPLLSFQAWRTPGSFWAPVVRQSSHYAQPGLWRKSS